MPRPGSGSRSSLPVPSRISCSRSRCSPSCSRSASPETPRAPWRRSRPDSPAAAAGLQEGDVILAVSGQPTSEFEEVSDRIRASKGRPITVTVERDGETIELGPTAGAAHRGPLPDRLRARARAREVRPRRGDRESVRRDRRRDGRDRQVARRHRHRLDAATTSRAPSASSSSRPRSSRRASGTTSACSR